MALCSAHVAVMVATFCVQAVGEIRLTRNSQNVLVHNIVTGEVSVVEEAAEWTSCQLKGDDARGAVVEHTGTDNVAVTTSVWDWLQLSRDEDDLLDCGDGSRSSWCDMEKVTVPLALSLTKGQSVFKCELQAHKVPLGCGCSIFWHLRWLVDWLGGHKNSNFIGAGAKSWAKKVVSYLPFCSDVGRDIDMEQLSRLHFQESSQSKLRQMRRPSQNDAVGDEVQMSMCEYSASSLAMLVMLSHWSARGPDKRSQWKLGTDHVSSRAASLLNLLVETFVTASLSMEVMGVNVILLLEGGAILLDWPRFCEAVGLELLKRLFPDAEGISCVDALLGLCKEEVNSRVSASRRWAATTGFAVLCQALVLVIESSKQDALWKQTELWQLQPLSRRFCFLRLRMVLCF